MQGKKKWNIVFEHANKVITCINHGSSCTALSDLDVGDPDEQWGVVCGSVSIHMPTTASSMQLRACLQTDVLSSAENRFALAARQLHHEASVCILPSAGKRVQIVHETVTNSLMLVQAA